MGDLDDLASVAKIVPKKQTAVHRANPSIWIAATILLVSISVASVLTYLSYHLGPERTAVTTISGSSWISRNSGGSDVVRGLKIQIYADTVNSSGVVRALEESSKAWAESAKDSLKSAEQSSDYPEMVKRDRDDARSAKARSVAALAASQSVPDPIRVDQAYTLVGQHKRIIPNFEYVIPTINGESTTDVDGKYTIDGVAAGNYFVHAVLVRGVLIVEWLIPIKCSGEPLTVNLGSESAIFIHQR